MFASRGKLFFALLLLITTVLSGCKNTTLQNGIAKTSLSGNAEATQTFKFTLPANTTALMIQSSANDQLQLQLQDANKAPISGCWSATFCTTGGLAAGTYHVQVSALGPYSGQSLVAAWSGPDAATLKNNQPVTGLTGKAGTVVLQSLHIPFYIGELNLQTTATGTYSLELLDTYGTVLHTCSDSQQCSISQTFNGDYFVRITGQSDFANLNILAAWGGAQNATIENGVTMSGIAGNANSERVESLYIEPGTLAFMLQKTRYDAPVFLEILDENGQLETYCSDICTMNAPAPGRYYVRMLFAERVTDFSFVAVWAGENGGQLKNGVTVHDLRGDRDEALLTSMYIPENTHGLMVQASDMPGVYPELLDAYGNVVSYYGNVIDNPAPGVYFVRTRLFEDNVEFALTAAWAANQQGTLQNGVLLTGLSGNQDDALLASIYIPENTHGLMVQTSDVPGVYPELLDANGNPVSYYGNVIDNPIPGVYYVRTRVFEDNVEFALTAAWATNGQGTLQNGVLLAGLSGNQDDALLASSSTFQKTPTASWCRPATYRASILNCWTPTVIPSVTAMSSTIRFPGCITFAPACSKTMSNLDLLPRGRPTDKAHCRTACCLLACPAIRMTFCWHPSTSRKTPTASWCKPATYRVSILNCSTPTAIPSVTTAMSSTIRFPGCITSAPACSKTMSNLDLLPQWLPMSRVRCKTACCSPACPAIRTTCCWHPSTFLKTPTA
ncbi:MAG: hypothetical protein R3F47_11000 [Gammaproteobacteria bacterium]